MQKRKKKKKRIFHLTTSSKIAGAENLLIWLSKNYNREKFEMDFCTVFQPGDLNRELLRFNENVFSLDVKGTFSFFLAVFRLRKILIKTDPDVIHCHLFHSVLLTLLVKFFFLKNIKIVYTRHYGSFYHDHQSYVKHYIDKFIVNRVSNVIAVSESVQNYLVNDLQVSKHKIALIYNGIDIQRYDKPTYDVKEESVETVRQSDGTPKIGLIANYRSRKGHDFVFNFADELIRKYPSVKIFFVGEGYMRPQFEATILEKGWDNHVYLTGFCRNIPYILTLFDLVIMPSSNEAFGLVACEAMAAGVPVVAADVEGLSEIIRDQSNGFLFDLGSAQLAFEKIQFALDQDRDDLERITSRARQDVKDKFDFKRTNEQLEAYYEQILLSV